MKNIFKISLFNIFFFLSIISFNIIKSHLIFPLEYLPKENYKFFQNNTNTKIPEKLFQQIYYSNLITKIKIGSTKKNQIFFIETNNNKYYISSIITKNNSLKEEKVIKYYNIPEKELYNEELSSTYNEYTCRKGIQNIDHYNELCTGTEKMTFKNNENFFTINFPINIVKNRDENIPGVIGLFVNNTNLSYSRSLITELKNENLIDNYYWFINIDEVSPLEKKIKANLIIGALPHEIFPQKYSKENFKAQNIFTIPSFFEAWRIKMDKVYIEGNSNEIYNSIISFSYEYYHVIGTLEFKNIIKKKCMNKLIEEKKCFYTKFPQDITLLYNMTFYYCNKSAKNILYESIPAIKFFSFELSYIFELTKEELFYIKDDYIYFNVIFSENSFNYWMMGQIFTTKYNFVFNSDTKQIGFYYKENMIPNQNKEILTKKNNNNFFIIITIIIAIIFMCFGLIIGRKIFGLKRKIIVNELIEEQNYEYKSHNNNIKSKDIENNYKPIGNQKNGIFEMTKKFEI